MSLYDRERDRKGRRKSSPKSGGNAPKPLSDLDRPQPDEFYVKMLVKRLRWSRCEDRETVILIFRNFWPDPRIANRVEEFYESALTFIKEAGE